MTTSCGWHNSDIVAAVKKKTGLSLRQLSISNGFHENAIQQALHRPYPKSENLIARSIGVSAKEIWPDRFNSDGTRKDRRRKNTRTLKTIDKGSK